MEERDIYSVLDEVGGRNLKTRGKNVMVSCLLTKWRKGHKSEEDSTPSMAIKIEFNDVSVVKCFACGYLGTLEGLVLEIHQHGDRNLFELVRRVSEMEEIDLTKLPPIRDWNDRPVIEQDVLVEESRIRHMMGIAPGYFLKRGLTIDTLKVWQSGFDADRNRAVFPVRRVDGALVGLVGRAVRTLQEPKYYNYFEFKTGRFLFGAHLAKFDTWVIVVEGALDAVAVWQLLAQADLLGEFSVVSLFGTSGTAIQLGLLHRISDSVIVFFDNDAAGWMGVDRLAEKLDSKLYLKFVRYPEGTEWADPSKLIQDGVDVLSMIRDAKLYGLDRDWLMGCLGHRKVTRENHEYTT